MSATDIAAWIGAVTGTLVLIWDVYKWMQTGPSRLRKYCSVNLALLAG